VVRSNERLPQELPESPATAKDPEKDATAYLAKTKAEALAAVKALRAEEAALQARLKKIEGALQKWQSLLSALDPEGAWQQPKPVAGPTEIPASSPSLEALPPQAPAGEATPLAPPRAPVPSTVEPRN
jgi:hypothetical protein